MPIQYDMRQKERENSHNSRFRIRRLQFLKNWIINLYATTNIRGCVSPDIFTRSKQKEACHDRRMYFGVTASSIDELHHFRQQFTAPVSMATRVWNLSLTFLVLLHVPSIVGDGFLFYISILLFSGNVLHLCKIVSKRIRVGLKDCVSYFQFCFPFFLFAPLDSWLVE